MPQGNKRLILNVYHGNVRKSKKTGHAPTLSAQLVNAAKGPSARAACAKLGNDAADAEMRSALAETPKRYETAFYSKRLENFLNHKSLQLLWKMLVGGFRFGEITGALGNRSFSQDSAVRSSKNLQRFRDMLHARVLPRLVTPIVRARGAAGRSRRA